MDFNFSEEQLTLQDLARGMLEKEVTPERLREIEAGPEGFDRELWSTLAEAHLLGLVVPEELGGMGFGLPEVCMLLHEIGRTLAPVPVLPTLAFAGLPLAEFGSDAQKKAWLAPMAAGQLVLSAALVDAGSEEPARPATRARRNGSGWTLDGQKRFVPALHLAQRVLVPAATDAGAGVFLVDPQAEGITHVRANTSSGEPIFDLTLEGVAVGEDDLLGGDAQNGGEIALWIYQRALVAICATQLGVSEKALELTAGYVSQREQFGVPIGSFQAVQHRAADAYIDLEALRWVTWRAIWKLSQGLPASRETAVAKFWAAEAGSRIANSAQHLHAGIGVDVDYPIHRYFLWSKHLELSLGAAMPQLARLGRDMARTGPKELA